TFPLDTWHFVGAVYNGTGYKVYLDGNVIWTKTESLSGASAGNFQIGLTTAYGLGGNQFFGSIANVQFYNVNLTQSQVTQLYGEGVNGAPISEKNLVGWWPLDGNANDYSGFGYNGTQTNVAYVSLNGTYTAPGLSSLNSVADEFQALGFVG
ncbi:MAG: LamG-like jellyroll fold domain-containing protein, partial [Candidatus Micrarchaeia archaeon]